MIKTMDQLVAFVSEHPDCGPTFSGGGYKAYVDLYDKDSRSSLDTHKHAKLKKIMLSFPPARSFLAKRALKSGYINIIERYKIIKTDLNEYVKAYEMLEDERSKEVFVSVLMFFLTGDGAYIPQAYDPAGVQYLDKISGISAGEVVVDCGAFTGDTFADFMENGLTPSKYYAFEPDEKTIPKLLKTFDNYKTKSTECIHIPAGAFNENKTLYFNASGTGGSSISKTKTSTTIQAVKIDDVIHEPVTFIKMDIEGAEPEALEGARNTISTYKPKLAICIYHDIRHFYQIPALISDICPEYKHFHVRHYRNFPIETVLYATV